MLKDIIHTAIPVRDLKASKRFYCDTLGFLVHEEMKDANDQHVWLTLKPSKDSTASFTLCTVNDWDEVGALLDKTSKFMMHVIESDDCRQDIETYRKRGVSILSEPREESYGVMAAIADIDGNAFYIVEPPAPSTTQKPNLSAEDMELYGQQTHGFDVSLGYDESIDTLAQKMFTKEGIESFFVTKASGSFEAGKEVVWEWPCGSIENLKIQELKSNRAVFRWPAGQNDNREQLTEVCITIDHLPSDTKKSRITITEKGFPGNIMGKKESYENCHGWTDCLWKLKHELELAKVK